MIFHAKENIILFVFFINLKYHLSHFLKYHATFVNINETSSFYQLFALKKISFYSFKFQIHNFNFSNIRKLINSSFLLNMTLPFVQSSNFYNNVFLSYKETCFLTILKGFKPFQTVLIIR